MIRADQRCAICGDCIPEERASKAHTCSPDCSLRLRRRKENARKARHHRDHEWMAAYYQRHPEQIEKQCLKRRKYYLAHREQLNENGRRYYLEHREERLHYNLINRDKILEYQKL
jgi:hypothetical protein